MSGYTGEAQGGSKYAVLFVDDYDDAAPNNQSSYLALGSLSGATSNSGAFAATQGAFTSWAHFKNTAIGLRDHTDGDRVVTTAGRRTEVTGGRYELHVGRTAAPPNTYPAERTTQSTLPFDEETVNLGTRGDDDVYLRLGAADAVHFPTGLVPQKERTTNGQTTLVDDSEKIEELKSTIRPPALLKPFVWEDHANGNRLSTTIGDKIEIITGKNYTQVLGAEDYDVSEGALVVERTGNNPNAPGYDKTKNAERRPILVSRTWAKRSVSETWYGKDRDLPGSVFGTADDAGITAAVAASFGSDGESYEYTYAEKLYSQSGAAGLPVTSIEEKTYAITMKSTTDASSTEETTTISGESKSTTTAGSVEETTTVSGRIKSTTTADWAVDITMLKGGSQEITLAPLQGEINVGVLKYAVDLCGVSVELATGVRFEISSRPSYEFNILGEEKFTFSEFKTALTADTLGASHSSVHIQRAGTALSYVTRALRVGLGIV